MMDTLTYLTFCSDWTFEWVSQLVMFNLIPLCFNSILFLHWFDQIRSSSMTWYNQFLLTRLHWFQSYNLIQLISIWIFKRTEFHSIFPIPFNYLGSDVLYFTSHLEDGERRFQPSFYEHDWFSPDLKWNTWWWWCTNIPGGFNYFGLPTVKCDHTGITLSTFWAEVNTICIWT